MSDVGLTDGALGWAEGSAESELELAAIPPVAGLARSEQSALDWAVGIDLRTSSKRAIDLVVALIGLVLVAPLLLLIAFAIWVDSPGPVLFRQPRVGRNGLIFGMFKFRTMVVGADRTRSSLEPLNESSGTFKLRTDPRTTPVGRLLRRMSLDEIPQLLNVLRGEMSLVGPRPLIPEEDALVGSDFRARLTVWPGMTGPWQVLGPMRPPLDEMVMIDCAYASNWTLRADVVILIRTVWHVIQLRGL